MTAFDTLADKIKREDGPRMKAEALISGLADLVKASSNDQNVQRLSRDLRGAAALLQDALSAPAPAA